MQKWIIQKLKQLRPEINFDFSDKGMGRLFAEIFKDLCRYNVTAKEWYAYSDGLWKQDSGGMIASRCAKGLSDAMTIYSTLIQDERTRKSFGELCTKLCQMRFRKTMIEDSRDCYFFSNGDMDKNQFLLNCRNGVYDLKNIKLLPHSPDYLMGKIANVSYAPNADGTEWIRFINEVQQGDADKIEYLQKLFGISTTGVTAEESCYLLYGNTTRNGKSTCVETYAYMLGGSDGYALNIRPETLAIKPNSDSRQANGDIARLAGCRFLSASEPPRKMMFDAALLKSLLGCDTIIARNLYQSEFEFVPVFKLFINTNYLPVVADTSLFTSGRLNVITFDRHFKPEEQDKRLKDRLKEPENLSGLFNWCLDGLQKYYAQGLKPPKSVLYATKQYEQDSDKVGSFIGECLIASDENTKAKSVYDRYAAWCKENGFGVENKTNFFAELKVKGIFLLTGTVDGKTCKNVVKGYVVEEWMEASADVPFGDK